MIDEEVLKLEIKKRISDISFEQAGHKSQHFHDIYNGRRNELEWVSSLIDSMVKNP